jgi:hypothetical protein
MPERRVETYRGVDIMWEKTTDDTVRARVRFKCTINGQTLSDDWIDGLRIKIDAVLDPRRRL